MSNALTTETKREIAILYARISGQKYQGFDAIQLPMSFEGIGSDVQEVELVNGVLVVRF